MNIDHSNHSNHSIWNQIDPQVEEKIKGARGQAARVQIQNEATELHKHFQMFRRFQEDVNIWTTNLQTFPQFPEKFVSKATITQLMLVQDKQAQAWGSMASVRFPVVSLKDVNIWCPSTQ